MPQTVGQGVGDMVTSTWGQASSRELSGVGEVGPAGTLVTPWQGGHVLWRSQSHSDLPAEQEPSPVCEELVPCGGGGRWAGGGGYFGCLATSGSCRVEALLHF